MNFRVIDNKTGREPDIGDIALNEKWAFDLVYCDMEGFAITENGDLILLDECGNYEFCPQDRFTVEMEEYDKTVIIQMDAFMGREEIDHIHRVLLKQLKDGLIVIPGYAHLAHVGPACDVKIVEEGELKDG